MTETLGTARLEIVVDTAQFDTAINAAKRSVSGMSQVAQAEYNKLGAAEKRRVDSLLKQADTLGYTRQQQILYNAALRGVPTAVLDELKAKLGAVTTQQNALNAAQGASTKAFSGTAKTSRELQFALRGLPAQFTDIATSLASGQTPLLVLLQQGGQLKDMFGGLGPAVKALGGYIVGLINPFTVAAAAAGTLLLAFTKGESITADFNKALIATGGYAGRTAEQLEGLAKRFDNIAGVTQTSASEVIAKVAATGQFTGQVFDMVAEAAVRASESGIKSVEDTVDAFREIGKDPVAALLKLNDSERFLTQTQLDRIRTLRDEGREQDAVREAAELYFNVLNDRAGKAYEQTTSLASAWRAVKDAIAETADELINANLSKSPAQIAQYNIDAAKAQLRTISANLRAEIATGEKISAERVSAANKRIGELKALIASSRGAVPSAGGSATTVDGKEEARKQRELSFQAESIQYLEGRARLEAEIAKMRKDATRDGISKAAQDKRELEMTRQFEAQEAKRNRTRKTRQKADPADGILDRIQRQIALNNAQAASEDKLTASERLQVEVKRELEKMGGKITATRRAEIESALASLDVSGKLAERAKEEAKTKEELTRLTQQLTAAEDARRRANDADIAAVGLGGREVEKLRREIGIQEEFVRGMEQLNQRANDISAESYKAQEDALRQSRDRSLADEKVFWERMTAAQGNWANGARRALQDYADAARDIASQTAAMWGEALQTIEDIGVDALSGNLKSWSDYFENLHQMILRFIIRQQLTKWMDQLGSMDANSGGGGFMQFLGGLFQSASGGGWGGIAKGAAFGGGQRIEQYAMGGVFDQTTPFRHGSKLGVLGEAGPEAIMPLRRGPDGKLGVQMNGGGAAPVYMTQQVVVQGRPTQETIYQLERASGKGAARAMRRG